MQPDQLQQLRDIHAPAAPSWWPPAPGWWILGVLLLAAAAWGMVVAVRAYRRGAPVRRARALHHEIYTGFEAGKLSPAEYAHASNALLKRLFIHGLGVHQARRASDADWLEMLDRYAEAPGFAEGPGMALGNLRFRSHQTIDVPALHALISRLLQQRNLPARAKRGTAPHGAGSGEAGQAETVGQQ